MPRIIALLVLLTATAFAAVDITKPIASLALPDGRVLKNATLANFQSDTVLVRHAGGSLAIRYEFLPPEIRVAAEQKRPGGSRLPAGEASLKTIEIQGQVFLQTQGAGPYIMANVSVYAFDIEHLAVWENTRINPVKLPQPIAMTKSDGSGRFKFTIPPDRPYFIFAQGARVLTATKTEWYEWRAPSSEIKKLDEVFLTNSPWRYDWRPVEIEILP